jgi:hypothetical protein
MAPVALAFAVLNTLHGSARWPRSGRSERRSERERP